MSGSPFCKNLWVTILLGMASCLPPSPVNAAGAKLRISSATWSDGQLSVSGTLSNSTAPIDIFDINGRKLATAAGSPFSASVGSDVLPAAPCLVRVQAGALDAVKPVDGAPKSCRKVPSCKIVSPSNGEQFSINEDIRFKATAALKDPKGRPLRLEWDFAGGSMGELIKKSNPPAYRRPTSAQTTVQFIRDNARYRVRFTAMNGSVKSMEGPEARCEDSVDIIIGSPPGSPAGVLNMAADSHNSAPALGEQVTAENSQPGKLVVLPYEDWTFQNTSDMRLNPNGYSSASPPVNNLRAVVYSKDIKPPVVGDVAATIGGPAVDLKFSATSNPYDPVGPASINSTSQNWPVDGTSKLGAKLTDATIKKTDRWETHERAAEQRNAGYASTNWMQAAFYDYAWGDAPFYDEAKTQPNPKPDEGYFAPQSYGYIDAALAPNIEHGLRMPGMDDPYAVNTPQGFSRFNTDSGLFEANLLPLTGVDDVGRVNTFPLLRIEAIEKNNGQTVAAKVDAVATAGSDFHCRECHAQGKMAAKSNAQRQAENLIPFTDQAFHSSAFPKWWDTEHPPAERLVEPPFKRVTDLGGDPQNIQDQEYAAAFNYSSIHDFYDEMYFTSTMLNGFQWDATQPGVDADSPHPCYGCHFTPQASTPFNRAGMDMPGWDIDDPSYAPNYSVAMHRFHGQLQWNAKKTDIERDNRGVYKRWNWGQGPNNKLGQSLFPIFDAKGKQLPMEQNCLRCHAGHREQFYRDRMYTAGVTCYDCHGDMLAVGQAYPKNYPDNKNIANSKQRDDYRQPWFDQPDCGSCHVGTANVGKPGKQGFFSVGVRKRAFDDADWSATPRPVDLKDPDASRFAVVPNYQANFPVNFMIFGEKPSDPFLVPKIEYAVDTPLFRQGRDAHGNVPCAACHGAAHAVWPNRDPKANDNVTALQLQGHTGTILECNVCHTSESFRLEGDIDAGHFMNETADSRILGGPHNIHPVNDPYWWKSAEGDTENSDQSTAGGWHNNYAQKPGKGGEDQCVACHGNDRKGTRLSRTPVERVFDFSDLTDDQFAKLQKAGFKSRKITVPAGTPIGCNTCHSIATSCLKPGTSPDPDCGKATGFVNTSPNHPPQFAAPAVPETATIGADYSYDAKAQVSDQDNDILTFALGSHPANVSIDETTGMVTTTWPGQYLIDGGYSPPAAIEFVVTASDGRGGIARQTVNMTLSCPQGLPYLDKGLAVCTSTRIASTPPGGITAGDSLSYQVSLDPVLAAAYSLEKIPGDDSSAVPAGMSIAPDGLLTWATDSNSPETAKFRIIATDGQGNKASQDVSLSVCHSPLQWHEGTAQCAANTAPVVASPTQAELGKPAGKAWTLNVKAKTSDAELDTLSFALTQKPDDNMAIDPVSGVITWNPVAGTGSKPFAVSVDDGHGGTATLNTAIMVCLPTESWMNHGAGWQCMSH
jgi:hypothetical protein